ncbi:MAG: hypothetical protein IT538_15170 [Variibacter sp.]|nr:hypothetical protein [Variibacter sp.]
MATLLFKCPATGLTVQGWFSDEVSADQDTYEAISCPACSHLHFVNRKTGKALSASER